MDWKKEIDASRARIAAHVRRTPVTRLDPGLGREVEFKLEHMQVTGSFKPRGAFNSLLAAPPSAAGVVAASGGNHGAAVAHAAHRLGIPARIFVPEMAGPSKIALIRRTGAALEVVEGSYADALAATEAHAARTGAAGIHAYDAPLTVAGQGTLFAEWEEQGLAADTVLIAVGGGGLIAGALAWFGGSRNVVPVESVGTPTLHTALRVGADAEIEVSGIAANALGARRIGRICFDLARKHGVRSLLVDDDAIRQAQLALWREMRILVEPAGATAYAALLSGAYRPAPDERVAVLLCGGNVAPEPLS